MKIVIIDASLQEEGVSSVVIRRMIPFLKGNAYGILHTAEPMEHRIQRKILKAAEAIIIVTPVSCGGLPSSLMALLSEMEMHAMRENMPVCTIIHDEQTDRKCLEHAENMLKIWSEKCHVHLCMNLLISGADQLLLAKNIPVGNQTMKETDQALEKLADALRGNEKEDIHISTGSSFVYKRSMEHYWKKELALNGLRKSDASVRLNENSFKNK